MSEQVVEKKFDCFSCKWKRRNSGTVHIRCVHSSLGPISDNPMMNMMAILASVGRAKPMIASTKELNIRGTPTGIKRGWFNFPWDFDPTWLENCDGYEIKEDSD